MLSRGVDIHDWQVIVEAWNRMCNMVGTPSVDRFANSQNTKLPRFNSLLQHPSAEGWDAFAQDWSKDYNYVCAPFGLLDRISQHIIEQKAKTLVVIPYWKGQLWFQKLAPLVKVWIHLEGKDFVPGKAMFVEPWKNPAWKFYAVLVCP